MTTVAAASRPCNREREAGSYATRRRRATTGDNAYPVLIYYQAGITFSEAVDTERKDPSLSGKTINKGDISLQKIQNCNI